MGAYGGEDSRDFRPAWRRRMRRPWVPLGLLVLLFALIAIVPRHTPLSRTLPPGRWGAAIRCLEHNGSFRVTAFGTSAAPDSTTTSVGVGSTLGDHTLAELRLEPTAAAARAVVGGNRFGELTRSDYRTDGRIVWAYVESGAAPGFVANAGDRTLIDACVRQPSR